MLGIEDRYVAAAYVLCLLSTLLCIVYGLLMWNKGEEEIELEDLKWVSEEIKIEEEL